MDKVQLIDFCFLTADLFQSVLDIRVKTVAELSTDQHLLACNLCL